MTTRRIQSTDHHKLTDRHKLMHHRKQQILEIREQAVDRGTSAGERSWTHFLQLHSTKTW